MLTYGSCITSCSCGSHWKFGTALIKQVNSYKYLGIELDPYLSFKDFKKRICDKARQNMSKIWGMGMFNGSLSVKASINLYEALVRPLLEYGAEIWGDEKCIEAENLQSEMDEEF